MDSVIEIIDGQERITYIIPKIKGIKIYENKKAIGIVINEAGVPNVHGFNSESGAKEFYDDCIKKIEAYYKAMMPQNSGCSCKEK